jgi:hypothetical protein
MNNELVKCSICGVPDYKTFMVLKEVNKTVDQDGKEHITFIYLCQQCEAHLESKK